MMDAIGGGYDYGIDKRWRCPGDRMGGPDNRRICLAIEGGLEMAEKNRLKAAEVTISEIYTDDDSREQFVETCIWERI